MQLHLIEVPYDSGHWGTRMGRGPGALLAGGLAERLRCAGHAVEESRVQRPVRFPTEVATGFAVAAELALAVRSAAWQSRLPVALVGNCLASLGVVAGLGSGRIGVLWLDAHGDHHTPESTRSGFLDGMALAALTGRCWAGMTAAIPGFRPVDPGDVVLVGARDLDGGEGEALDSAGVVRVAAGGLAGLPGALDRLRERVDRLYLHLDLDVLDPAVGRANAFAAEGGLGAPELERVMHMARERFRVAGVALSAYDPEHDPAGAIVSAAGTALLELLAPPA